MNKQKISSLATDILNDIIGNEEWVGPNGECWCEALQRYVSPKKDKKEILQFCPEAEPLFALDKRKYDYSHKSEPDQKSYGMGA